MRLPFSRKPERRNAGGGYTSAIVAALEQVAASKVADVGATAALEAVAGLLSRNLSAATVDGPAWAQTAISPPWLALAGRSLVREGGSMSVVRMAPDGAVSLIPAAYWNFTGEASKGDDMSAVGIGGDAI